MLSFKQWLHEVAMFHNNPGGDWLRRERDRVKREDRRGPETAATKEAVLIPVKHIAHLKGENGEHEFRDDPTSFKHARLAKEVGHPSNFNSKDNPIRINVWHNGEPKIAEGNHRTAYAHRHGISHIHAHVAYYAGAEDEDGPLHPSKLKKIVKKG